MLCLNARSLGKNEDQISILANETKADILAFQETWQMDDAIKPHLNGYDLIDCTYRKKSRGGGTCMLVKNHVNVLARTDLSLNIEKCIETCAVEVDRGKSKGIIIINVYLGFLERDTALSRLDSLLRSIRGTNKEILLMGDFNTNFLDANSNDQVRTMISDIESYGLVPQISVPTRVENRAGITSATCIDNIFSTTRIASSSYVLTDKITDHFPLCHIIKNRVRGPRRKEITSRRMTDDNIRSAEEHLINSGKLLSLENIWCANEYATKLQSFIDESIEKCCPLVTRKVKNTSNPDWVSKGFLTSIKRNNTLHQKFMIKGSAYHYAKFKEYNNRLKKLIRVAKQLSVKRQIKEAGNNVRKQWQVLNGVMKRHKGKMEIGNILSNGVSISSNKEKAKLFNDYFSTVGSKLAETFPKNDNWKSYMQKRDSTFTFTKVYEGDIDKHIKSLKNKTSHGWDLMTNKILKQWSYLLTFHLATLVNLSLSQGVYPNVYKKTRVIPLYKGKGDKTSVNSYRPISLSPVLSKIIEKVVCKQTTDYLDKNNIIPRTHQGPRSRVARR